MNAEIKPTLQSTRILIPLALIFAILLGGFVRLVHVINLDFPLNDGGFFYVMVRDLQKIRLVLPFYTSYNASQIPYAYPPLPFYLTAVLANLTGWEVLDILRLLPPVVSILTIPAFYALSRRILPAAAQAIFATFAFAFLPTAFDWLIVGGGLTRSLGFLFAILTLIQVHGLYTTSDKRHIFAAILFANLTILCHPGTAWFTAFSAFILMLFHFRSQNGALSKTTIVLIGTTLLSAPWWLSVLLRFGIGTLLSPYQTENLSLASLLTPFTFLFTNEPLLGIVAFTGLLGFLVSLRDRSYYLPVWLIAVFLFESRLGATYAVLPVSMLAGIGIDRAVLPAAAKPRIIQIALGYLLAYALIAAFIAPTYQSLTRDQAEAMRWIQAHTPESSRFILVTGIPEYGVDYVSEWFPALSGRANLTVPQGHEWLPNREFTRRKGLHASLQACAQEDLACIQTWADQNQVDFTHIFIPSKASEVQTRLLRQSLDESPAFERLYSSPGGTVYALKP